MSRKGSMILMVFLMATALANDLPGSQFWDLQAQIAESFKKQDYRTALEQLKHSDALVPNRPSSVLRMARAHARLHENDAAMTQLTRLRDMQTYFDLAHDPAFADLGKGFENLVSAMEKLKESKVTGATVAFKIPDTTFFPEGIAYDTNTGDVFVASMRKRKIVRISPTGTITDFIAPHQYDIWGISGIGIDAAHKTLWACSTAYEVNEEYKPTDRDAAAFAFDLVSGRLKARYPFQRQEERHFCDGVAIGSDGTIFVADSQGMAVLKISPGAKELATLLPQSAGISPQGMAVSADGKTLFVSDYMSGLYALNLKTKQVSRLESKAKASLAGIDGLIGYGNDLIAIQNGILPNRVVRLKMGPSQKEVLDVQVLEMNHPLFGEPTLGVIKGNMLLFVANNPISKFLDDHQLSELPTPVILQRDLR